MSCRGGILIASGMMLNVLACALIYEPADEHVRLVTTLAKMSVSSSSSSSTVASISSINTRITINRTNEYYAAVVSSPSLPLPESSTDAVARKDFASTARRWLFGTKPAAEFLAVSAINVIGHLAYAVFAATTKPKTLHAATLHLAAANAAGRILVPVASDLLSPGGGGSASIYLYAVVMAIGGVVLLMTASTLVDGPPLHLKVISPSPCLLVLFGLASGAAVGLEPLVAVRVLGRERLAASYSATLLGKGAVQLVVDLIFVSSAGPYAQEQQKFSMNIVSLYVLGSGLMVVTTSWMAVFLIKRHCATKYGCSRYVRTV